MESATHDPSEPSQGSRMTAAEVEQAKALMAMGLSHRLIAEQLGRSRTGISNLAERLGLQSKVKKRPWTENDFFTVSRLLAAGKPHAIIARVMDRSPKALELYIHTHRGRLSLTPVEALSEPTPEPPPKPQPRHRPAEIDLYQRWLAAMRRVAASVTP